MGNPGKMIYVRKGDQTFWERGEKRADAEGVPMSAYVMRLVRNDVTRGKAPETPQELAEKIAADTARLKEMLSS